MNPTPFHTARRLALRLLLLAALCAGALLLPLHLHARTLPTQPWLTDARLPGMPRDTDQAALLLGSSRAYLLSRFAEHHPLLEARLGGPVTNLALPTGGGIRPARLYFDEYLARGNRPRAVLYGIDPFVFYGLAANDAHKFVYFESFEIPFLLRLLRNHYPLRETFAYLRSKLTWDWFTRGPEPLHRHDGQVRPQDVHPDRIQLRFDSLYLDGRHEPTFQRNAAHLRHIAQTCADRRIPLHLVILPTLLGPEPGAPRMHQWIQELAQELPLQITDLTGQLQDPALYYNLDHLNTPGVQSLLPLLPSPAPHQPPATSH